MASCARLTNDIACPNPATQTRVVEALVGVEDSGADLNMEYRVDVCDAHAVELDDC